MILVLAIFASMISCGGIDHGNIQAAPINFHCPKIVYSSHDGEAYEDACEAATKYAEEEESVFL